MSIAYIKCYFSPAVNNNLMYSSNNYIYIINNNRANVNNSKIINKTDIKPLVNSNKNTTFAIDKGTFVLLTIKIFILCLK